jgi:hypothetical protein
VSRRDRALALAMPLLLVVVAVAHQVRVRALDQSSWHGSGFGMFATYDSEQTRTVRAWLEPSGQPVPVPDTDTVLLARIVPTDSNARAVARHLADRGAVRPGERVRVEVRGVDVDDVDGDLTVETLLLASAALDVGSAGS